MIGGIFTTAAATNITTTVLPQVDDDITGAHLPPRVGVATLAFHTWPDIDVSSQRC